MPADPLPARGRAARCPRGRPVSGEGADRDQAQKRGPRHRELEDQRRTAERNEGAGGLPVSRCEGKG